MNEYLLRITRKSFSYCECVWIREYRIYPLALCKQYLMLEGINEWVFLLLFISADFAGKSPRIRAGSGDAVEKGRNEMMKNFE